MAGTIESFIETTNAATSAKAIFEEFKKTMKNYGYDRTCYSLLTNHPFLDLPAGHGVFGSYPEDWMKYYMANNYLNVDPVIKYAFCSDKPFTWNFVTKNLNISKAQKRLMNQASEANLLNGVAVPMHGINGEVSGVGLASSTGRPDADKTTLMIINAICHQFHLSYTDLIVIENGQKRNPELHIQLTNREQEILSWAAEGKSDADIADILNISYSTVRFHLNNTYFKLGTNEKIFAVTKAIRLGLILPNLILKT